MPTPSPALRAELLEDRLTPAWTPTTLVDALPVFFTPTSGTLESDNRKFEFRPVGVNVPRVTFQALPFGDTPDTPDSGAVFGSLPPAPPVPPPTQQVFFTGTEYRIRW